MACACLLKHLTVFVIVSPSFLSLEVKIRFDHSWIYESLGRLKETGNGSSSRHHMLHMKIRYDLEQHRIFSQSLILTCWKKGLSGSYFFLSQSWRELEETGDCYSLIYYMFVCWNIYSVALARGQISKSLVPVCIEITADDVHVQKILHVRHFSAKTFHSKVYHIGTYCMCYVCVGYGTFHCLGECQISCT